jgi:anti-sigma regulatory factor (Ser/Thr protein kinase)
MNSPPAHDESMFRHEALLYAGEREFLAGTSRFIRDGLDRDEATLVVVDAPKITALREALNGDADRVMFADMAGVGLNPARIIPAWRDFVSEHGGHGRRVRGIGEPIGPARGTDELAECHRHEALLNLAFAEDPGFWLLCPYDTEALAPAVVAEARRTHPFLTAGGPGESSDAYAGLEAIGAPFAEPLPEPAEAPAELPFDAENLAELRSFAARHADAAGLDAARGSDLVLAVNEVATNSLRHGAGRGLLRVWREPRSLVCEVRDEGRFNAPMAGRERPLVGQVGGYGMWLANQLCELVQVRSFPGETVVRLHISAAR